MTDLVDRYLRLGLRLGRLADGLVDAYFGPPELAVSVAVEPAPTPAAVVGEAEALLADLPDGWLRDQVTGVRTYAGMLAGEVYSLADEAQGCYGVRPVFTDEAVFEAAHERLAELLPGPGPLAGRYQRWRESMLVPPGRVEPLVSAVIELARDWTERLVPLPAGEGIDLELVHDQPWSGFNTYLGDLRGRVSLNVDLPRSVLELLRLTLHETYPGHQAERALKDQHLVREQGRLEETLILGPAPQALISEGSAELAPDMVLTGPDGPAFAADLDLDLEHALAVDRAAEPLRWVEANAVLLRHEARTGDGELRSYLRRWGLLENHLADRVIEFLDAPGNRTYPLVYPVGRDRCRAYVDGDPARFRQLLTEQLRVSDLER